MGKFYNILPNPLRARIVDYLVAHNIWFNIKTVRKSSTGDYYYAFVQILDTSANSIVTNQAYIATQLVRISVYDPPGRYYS